jgi:hypothetical protein
MNGVEIQVEQRPRARNQRPGDGAVSSRPSRSSRRGSRYRYDPQGHVRVQRLRIARQWMERGAVYQAISAYGDMLDCCAGSYAAAAAAEELLETARALERQGQFYAALGILKRIESVYRG